MSTSIKKVEFPQFDRKAFTNAPIFEIPVPEPIGYRVIVRPISAATKSEGGIAYSKSTLEAERALTTIGKVLAIGHLAWKLNQYGLDHASDPSIPKVGDYVVYGRHAGQVLRIKRSRDEDSQSDEQEIIKILTDSDIHCKLKPGQENQFWHWVR